MGEVNDTPVFNPESILDSVKKDLGIAVEYTHFDPDVILGINSAISVLNQLGVGPREGFKIHDRDETWTEFLGDDPRLEMVKEYVAKKTKQFFDPPQTGPLATALDQVLKEMEWRVNIAADTNTNGGI